ncbi:MAG: metallophosphoesterase [Anaerolineae bacterium]|nr:metallophosphoesterase [Anaerolineae bacterium]
MGTFSNEERLAVVMTETYVISDIHGYLNSTRTLLQDIDLIGSDDTWTGGQASLWVLGDFFDHGPAGLEAVQLVRQLQAQAAAVGGKVGALIGNHDILLLAAYRFGQKSSTGSGGTFLTDWQESGGVESDLANLTPEIAGWLANLPALALTRQALLAHADGIFYFRYGKTMTTVNRTIRRVLHSNDYNAWNCLLDDFGEHRAFLQYKTALEVFLDSYGGHRLVHGHTPISKITNQPPETIDSPFIYAGGRCINVDGGMYLGGSGCFYRLPDEEKR